MNIFNTKLRMREQILKVGKRLIRLSATDTMILSVLGQTPEEKISELELREHFTEHTGNYWIRSRVRKTKAKLKKRNIPLSISVSRKIIAWHIVEVYTLKPHSSSWLSGWRQKINKLLTK